MPVSRRDFLRTSMATVCAVEAAGATLADEKATPQPNLLWIMTDQQPVSTLGCYGNGKIKTPNLDRIAAEGMRFDQFHIAAFPCSPSRASFLTGRYAHNHGVVVNDVPLDDAVPALGDILSKAGYATGYVGKWHLSGSMYRGLAGQKPFNGEWYYKRVADPDSFKYEQAQGETGEDASRHGFNSWTGGWKQYRDYLREAGLGERVDNTPVGNHNDLPSGPEGTHIYSQLPEEHHMASFFADQAVTFLDKQKESETPFSLVLSFYGPHLPVAPPKPWDEMYTPEDVALPANHDDTLDGKPTRQLTNRRCYKGPAWEENQFLDYIRRYWGYCSYIDHQIGRVLDALDASGKANDTIVLFTADHGDMITAHGFVFKLCHCGYDELLRVPFLLRYPGRIPAGTSNSALVSSVDVLPTLLEMMGVAPQEGIEGRAFPLLARGKVKTHRGTAFCASMQNNFTVITDTWKYVLNWNPRDLDELYDRVNDPGEMKNLAADPGHAATVAEMRAALTQWLEETGYPYRDQVVDAMNQEAHPGLDLWPEITRFNYLGGNEFEYEYTWHATDAPPGDMKYWSFTHFANPKYGKDSDIAFRDTTWPEPPTTTWQAGNAYEVGPIRVRVPDYAGPGKYEVRIGLYNPEHRASPGNLRRGEGNNITAGELFIEKKQGQIAAIRFTPIKVAK